MEYLDTNLNLVTEEIRESGVILDYLSFTFKPENEFKYISRSKEDLKVFHKLPIDYFFELFGEDLTNFLKSYGVYRPFGTNHYGKSIKVCAPKDDKGKSLIKAESVSAKGYSVDFIINYCEPDDDNLYDYAYNMGVNVSIPSHFIKVFMQLCHFDKDDLPSFLSWLYRNDCKASRIDLCWDDFSMRYTPHDYIREEVCGNLVTRCSKGGFLHSKQNEGGTFALGSKDTKYLRIYDKNYESGGSIPSVRYEVMYTGKFAKLLHQNLLKCGTQINSAKLICVPHLRRF